MKFVTVVGAFCWFAIAGHASGLRTTANAGDGSIASPQALVLPFGFRAVDYAWDTNRSVIVVYFGRHANEQVASIPVGLGTIREESFKSLDLPIAPSGMFETSPTGRYLLYSAGEGLTILMDLSTRQVLHKYLRDVEASIWSPDGTFWLDVEQGQGSLDTVVHSPGLSSRDGRQLAKDEKATYELPDASELIGFVGHDHVLATPTPFYDYRGVDHLTEYLLANDAVHTRRFKVSLPARAIVIDAVVSPNLGRICWLALVPETGGASKSAVPVSTVTPNQDRLRISVWISDIDCSGLTKFAEGRGGFSGSGLILES